MPVRQRDRLRNIYYNRDYMMIRTMIHRLGACSGPCVTRREGIDRVLQFLFTCLRRKSLM